jgi:hypothetical protein
VQVKTRRIEAEDRCVSVVTLQLPLNKPFVVCMTHLDQVSSLQ